MSEGQMMHGTINPFPRTERMRSKLSDRMSKPDANRQKFIATYEAFECG